MPDDRAAEPPPGTPGRRALGAMEIAVRRAREAAGATPLPPAPPTSRPPASRPWTPPESRSDLPLTAPPLGDVRPPRRNDRWLVGAVAVVATLVVAGLIALVVSVTGGSSPPSPTATGSPATRPSPSPTAPNGGAHGTTTTTTTTAPVAVAAGGPPVISSLSPSDGAAGQAIVVAGANFLSSSGQIVATFNGQVAPTSCPAQNTCNVTVPASTTPSAQVAITTAGGTSNAMTFTYG